MHVNGRAVLDFVSIVGAVILFGAWAFQQTSLNQANEATQNLHSAETSFETYQSNNTIFNALNAAAPPAASSEIRRFQIINYEYALTRLEKPLSAEEQAQLPAAPRPLDGDWNALEAMNNVQKRIEAIQAALSRRKQEIAENSASTNRTFLILYAAGSLLILAVNIGKILLPSSE
jgi:hypothetical protein